MIRKIYGIIIGIKAKWFQNADFESLLNDNVYDNATNDSDLMMALTGWPEIKYRPLLRRLNISDMGPPFHVSFQFFTNLFDFFLSRSAYTLSHTHTLRHTHSSGAIGAIFTDTVEVVSPSLTLVGPTHLGPTWSFFVWRKLVAVQGPDDGLKEEREKSDKWWFGRPIPLG